VKGRGGHADDQATTGLRPFRRRCSAESMGSIAVEIIHNGNLSHSVTNGGTLMIAVR
jgi:hypothetical protein